MIEPQDKAEESVVKATELQDLSRQKVKAEIDEIRLRIENEKTGPRSRQIRTVVKYVSILVPVVVALLGVILNWREYVDQRERLARFEAGPEIIELAEKLNNPKNESERALAAHQLAWFGRPAVFLLFERLVNETRPKVRSAIVLAIDEIASDDNREPGIFDLLVKSTSDFVSFALSNDEPMVFQMDNRLAALADVAATLQIGQDDSNIDEAALKQFQILWSWIDAQPTTQLTIKEKEEFQTIIHRVVSVKNDR